MSSDCPSPGIPPPAKWSDEAIQGRDAERSRAQETESNLETERNLLLVMYAQVGGDRSALANALPPPQTVTLDRLRELVHESMAEVKALLNDFQGGTKVTSSRLSSVVKLLFTWMWKMTMNEYLFRQAMQDTNCDFVFPQYRAWGLRMVRVCFDYNSGGRKVFLSVLGATLAHMIEMGDTFAVVCHLYEDKCRILREERDAARRESIEARAELDTKHQHVENLIGEVNSLKEQLLNLQNLSLGASEVPELQENQ